MSGLVGGRYLTHFIALLVLGLLDRGGQLIINCLLRVAFQILAQESSVQRAESAYPLGHGWAGLLPAAGGALPRGQGLGPGGDAYPSSRWPCAPRAPVPTVPPGPCTQVRAIPAPTCHELSNPRAGPPLLRGLPCGQGFSFLSLWKIPAQVQLLARLKISPTRTPESGPLAEVGFRRPHLQRDAHFLHSLHFLPSFQKCPFLAESKGNCKVLKKRAPRTIPGLVLYPYFRKTSASLAHGPSLSSILCLPAWPQTPLPPTSDPSQALWSPGETSRWQI